MTQRVQNCDLCRKPVVAAPSKRLICSRCSETGNVDRDPTPEEVDDARKNLQATLEELERG